MSMVPKGDRQENDTLEPVGLMLYNGDETWRRASAGSFAPVRLDSGDLDDNVNNVFDTPFVGIRFGVGGTQCTIMLVDGSTVEITNIGDRETIPVGGVKIMATGTDTDEMILFF